MLRLAPRLQFLHAPASRGIARSVRNLHVTTHTIEYPTPETITSLLPRDTPFTIVFSLSTSLPAESLAPLLSALPTGTAGNDDSASASESVGGFHLSDVPSASLAILQPQAGDTLRTFHNETTGRAPVQVGKWQRLGTSWADDKAGAQVGELEAVLGGGGWEDVWRGEEEDASLGLDPQRTRAVLCFTDGTPQPFLSALSGYDAVTLGLVSAPTPFLTGRPHTLFRNGIAYSTGSVGVALSAPPTKAEVVYGIEPLDKAYTVANARGNLLLTTEEAPNPTQALIAALQRRDADRPKGEGLTKDEDFWMSITSAGSEAPRIVRILSGDPSRGTMSIDTSATLKPGDVVQFMHRPTAPPPILPLSASIRFATLQPVEGFAEPVLDGATRIMPGFLAASEGGFIYGAPRFAPAVCTVSGASVTARWWS